MARRPVPPGDLVDLGLFRPGAGPRRRVRAYVPHGLGDADPAPLLVMFDGQNVFGDDGSYAGGWHAHTAVDALKGRTFWQPRVVAIDNGGVHRIREMGQRVRPFVASVADRLLPELLARFPVRPPVVIAGSSLGGLAALVGLFHHPASFGAALAMSPSLWFGEKQVFEGLVEAGFPMEARLYLDAGAKESARMWGDARQLAAILRARGVGDDALMWRPDPRGTHQERHWRRRLPKALRFLFRR